LQKGWFHFALVYDVLNESRAFMRLSERSEPVTKRCENRHLLPTLSAKMEGYLCSVNRSIGPESGYLGDERATVGPKRDTMLTACVTA